MSIDIWIVSCDTYRDTYRIMATLYRYTPNILFKKHPLMMKENNSKHGVRQAKTISYEI